ncbi:MAG: GNAT family N-acetyltransferase [Lachnospiraceae bacterium]|nr:GNAT family N-acetyltransferase [Lachnospiraceae bacterium]
MDEFKIIKITREHAFEMSGMLPQDVLWALRDDLPVTALAVAKGNTVAGALSGAANGDFFDISSIYVAKDYRRQGAGTALMKKLFELLDEEELMVRAEYDPRPLQRDTVEEKDSLEPFFIALGLTEEEITYPSYISEPLKRFTGDIERTDKSGGKIMRFLRADKELLKELADNEDENGTGDTGDGRKPSWSLLAETVDEYLSLCKVKDDKIVAYVAVDTALREPVEISAVWFTEEDISDMKWMLSKVIEGLNKEYDPDTEIVMLAMGPGAQDTVRAVCPEAGFLSKRFVRQYYEEI